MPRPDPQTRSSQILLIANRQHGVVSRRQLMELGMTRGSIQGGTASLRLTAVYPGVYAVGHSRLTIHGQWMAGVLASGPASALSHRSAAANWGITTPPKFIELLRSSSPDESFPRYAAHPTPFGKRLVIHRSRVFGPNEYTILNGIRTTSVPRTFLDLASVWSIRKLDSAFTEAERLGLVEIRKMLEITRHGRGWKGIGKLRQVVDSWDPTSTRTKSELEIEFRRLCGKYEIPMPEVNVMVAGFEVDCFWRDRALIIELDSYRHHRSPQAFERDKERNATLDDLDLRVMRLTYKMVTKDAAKTAKRVKRRLGERSGSDPT